MQLTVPRWLGSASAGAARSNAAKAAATTIRKAAPDIAQVLMGAAEGARNIVALRVTVVVVVVGTTVVGGRGQRESVAASEG